MTLTRKEVAAYFERSGGRPSRALGQNFLVDPNTVRKIVRLAEVQATDSVIEIGAGLGSLTLALAETGATITAIEIDKYLIDELAINTRECPNVTIEHCDAMKIDWPAFLAAHPSPTGRYVLVANLPYNVATPLLCDLLDFVPEIGRMLVMVQKEVGDRLAAKAGSEAYGAVSVKVAYWAEAKTVGTVPPSVFIPQPNVDSGLVRIDRLPAPAVDPALVGHDRLFDVVKTGFGQRRKMLRRSLAALVAPEAFAAAGVAPEARPEELDVLDWGRLARIQSEASTIEVEGEGSDETLR